MRLACNRGGDYRHLEPRPTPPGVGAHCDQWEAIFLGKIDDARKGAPAPACPHVCMEAIGAHVYADTCLISQCAGDAPSIDTATTAVIAATVAVVAVAAVAVAAPPLLPPSPLPPRRSHACPRRRRSDTPSGTSEVTEARVFFRADGPSFVGSCDCDRWGAVELSGSTLMRFAKCLRAVLRVLCRAMVWSEVVV